MSPGDIVMLTAAVRDLHRCHADEFRTDVRTSCLPIWDHNPLLTRLEESDPGVELVECQYPLIHQSNQGPYHCLHGFIDFLNDRFGLRIRPTEFRGDIHLSPEEKSWHSQVYEAFEEDIPFWIVNAGGKYDVTIKWWDTKRYQQVVDYFEGRVLFVQIGSSEHHHPPLKGVLNLLGKTDLRQLIRLMYHAQGVLCGVTAAMHLAAAVEMKGRPDMNRPCVVVAGGREPAHWEAYPDHQYIGTNGTLACCRRGGCWKDRTLPLNDGDARDHPDRLCVDVRNDLPRCMDMIAAEDVIRRIEMYLEGGLLQELTHGQFKRVKKILQRNSIQAP